MVHQDGFQIVRRHHQQVARDNGLDCALSALLGTPCTTTTTSSPSSSAAASSASTKKANNPASTTSRKASSAAAASTAAAASAGSSANQAVSSTANGNNAASLSSAQAAASASATSAAAAAASLSSVDSTALTTQLFTASNGSVATTVLPIGSIPTANPFGNVIASNSTSLSAVAPISSILVPSGGYGSGEVSDTGSSSSNSNRIIIPVAVIAGVLALGLLVALFLTKQRNAMERELKRPMMMSNKENLAAASAGALGFTAAGVFRRNRRGSDYGKSSNGHGLLAARDNRESVMVGRPMSVDDAIYSDALHDREDTQSFEFNGFEGDNHTAEMSNAEVMAAADNSVSRPHSVLGSNLSHYQVGQAYSTSNHNHYPQTPMESSIGGRRQSFGTGEGGYATASEDASPTHDSFFDHNRPQMEITNAPSSAGHYDGSASHGYSNPATRGLDAAAVQDATGGQMLSPYLPLQRNDPRTSVANTELSSGQAYDGADLGEDPFNLAVEHEARPNPHYDGNRVMQHPQLNSSRWSG